MNRDFPRRETAQAGLRFNQEYWNIRDVGKAMHVKESMSNEIC